MAKKKSPKIDQNSPEAGRKYVEGKYSEFVEH